MRKIIAFLCIGCLLLSGCGSEDGDSQSTEVTQAPDTITDFAQTDTQMFTDRDRNATYDAKNAVTVRFDGTTAASDSNSVTVDGSTVTLTKEATYLLSGTLRGLLVVDAGEKDKLQLVFQNANIQNSTGAALYIKNADKVFITLAEGTDNTLTAGDSFIAIDDSNIDGALFSRQDLTVNGSGSLTVTSPAGHGIVCKDDLVLTGGNLTVTAASHGLDANDSIRLTDTTLSVTAGKDGLHAENSDDTTKGFVYLHSGTLHITAEGDGISAGAYGQLEMGTVKILAGGGSENGTKASSGNYGGFMPGGGGFPGGGGGYPGGGGRPQRPGGNAPVTPPDSPSTTTTDSTSMKGIKAGTSLLINNGTYTIDSADDALHANENITVKGGNFTLKTGDDGVHAEEYLVVTDCAMTISESYEGLEALHIQVDGGDVTLTATDDGLNAAGGVDASGAGGRDGQFGGRAPGQGASNGSILITGGQLQITASGDGIDANGTLSITGGHITVTGPTRGDTATLDFDAGGTISGGTFIGTGAQGMGQSFRQSNQAVITLQAGAQAAGTAITLTDSSGTVLISHTPAMDFQLVILSCPQLVKDQTYTVTLGSTTHSITAS